MTQDNPTRTEDYWFWCVILIAITILIIILP